MCRRLDFRLHHRIRYASSDVIVAIPEDRCYVTRLSIHQRPAPKLLYSKILGLYCSLGRTTERGSLHKDDFDSITMAGKHADASGMKSASFCGRTGPGARQSTTHRYYTLGSAFSCMSASL